MKHSATVVRHGAAFALIGSLALVGLLIPAATSAQTSADRAAAAKVARKVEKAREAGERAEKEASEAVRHFHEELTKYERLHAAQLRSLGNLEPAKVQEALARALVSKRAEAKLGDIFRKDVQPLFRGLIAEQLKGPDTAAAQKAVDEGNPTLDEDSVSVLVKVNAAYPTGASRSTVPPSLLLALPPLPPCLHYRFVGRDLVLVDSVAQIIVDFLPAATPAPVAR